MDKKAAILKSGKELFSAKGFKETNVSEIMELAGFATGTFYNYYVSKDQLFMEIFIKENVKLKKRTLASVDLDDDPRNVMKEMMIMNMQGMLSNPILKEWYNRELFSKIEHHFREENGLKAVDFLYNQFIVVVKKWQKDKKMRQDIDPEMIMAIFSALINIETHKEEVGIHYFPTILEYMSEFIMNGLMMTPVAKMKSGLSDDLY